MQRLDIAKKVVFAHFATPKQEDADLDESDIEFTGGIPVNLGECFDLKTREEQYFWYVDKGLLPTEKHRTLMAKQMGCDLVKLAAMQKERDRANS